MPHFKIAAAQVASVRGDIDQNIAIHVAAIRVAAQQKVSMLIFPELSLTGYEPELAAEQAITPADNRLGSLLALARQHQIEAVVGAPLRRGTANPALGAIVFGADGTTRTYGKMHLGGSEPNYFTPGDTPLVIAAHGHTAGIAICADASQSSHPQAYADTGAKIYAASVFLNEEWYQTDAPRLASYSTRFQMLVVMANHGASVGSLTSVGKSGIWSPDGSLLAQASNTENALVIATSHNGAWGGNVARI